MSKLYIQYEEHSKELSRGLCTFFNSIIEPTLCIKNEGIEIYEQSSFDFENLKENNKLLPQRKNKFENKKDDTKEKMVKSKSAKKIVNRQGVSLILQNKFIGDPKTEAILQNDVNAIHAKVTIGKNPSNDISTIESYGSKKFNSGRRNSDLIEENNAFLLEMNRIKYQPNSQKRRGNKQRDELSFRLEPHFVQYNDNNHFDSVNLRHGKSSLRTGKSIDYCSNKINSSLVCNSIELFGSQSKESKKENHNEKLKKMQSAYSSLWSLRTLENFYDIKCSDTGSCDSSGKPIFKIRKISQNPWKQVQANNLSNRNQKAQKYSFQSNKNSGENTYSEQKRLSSLDTAFQRQAKSKNKCSPHQKTKKLSKAKSVQKIDPRKKQHSSKQNFMSYCNSNDTKPNILKEYSH